MKRSLLLGALLALTLSSGAASGQGGVRQDSAEPSQPPVQRPRLGVRVDIRPRDTDSIGAYVEMVLPGSPADRAGIRAGDIITKLDGQPIGATADRPSAGMRLVRRATELKPKTTVAVELRRGTMRKTVTVVTPNEITLVFRGSPNDSGKGWSFRVQTGLDTGNGGQRLVFLLASPLAALETAALNPELGEYFGTTKGVLVIKCPPETGLALKGGDVIIAVNGRTPADPAHFMRLVQQEQPTDPIRLTVLRHGKRFNFTVQLNSKDSH